MELVKKYEKCRLNEKNVNLENIFSDPLISGNVIVILHVMTIDNKSCVIFWSTTW